MLINKNKKSKKLNAFGLTAILGVSTLAAVTSACCLATTSVSKQVSNQKAIGSNDIGNNVVGAPIKVYKIITFVLPAEPTGVKYTGSTIVKIKTGAQFGTIVRPDPVLAGYQVNGWRDANNPDDIITEATKIMDDITIEPIMGPVSQQLSIIGRKKIYDGIPLTLDNALAESWYNTYSVQAAGGAWGPNDQVSLTEVVPASGQARLLITDEDPTILDPTQKKAPKGTYYIRPLFVDDEPHKVTLHAAATRQGSTEVTADIEITVAPPFYAQEEIAFDPVGAAGVKTQLGNLIWTVSTETPTAYQSANHWVCASQEEICYDPTATGTENDYITYNDLTYGTQSSTTPIDVLRIDSDSTTDTHKSTFTDVYPGYYVTTIEDHFFAMTNKYSPALHGGAKQISCIGHDFMYSCTEYNQNISALFNEGVTDGLTIGNNFLYDCTSFTNGDSAAAGGNAFVMPYAKYIGDYFMSGCNVNQVITIKNVTEGIGSNFMADSAATGLIIGEDPAATVTPVPSHSQLTYFGPNIMERCDDLATLEFAANRDGGTPSDPSDDYVDFTYLKDLEQESDKIGSFTYATTSEPTDANIRDVTVTIAKDTDGSLFDALTETYDFRKTSDGAGQWIVRSFISADNQYHRLNVTPSEHVQSITSITRQVGQNIVVVCSMAANYQLDKDNIIVIVNGDPVPAASITVDTAGNTLTVTQGTTPWAAHAKIEITLADKAAS